MDSTKRRPLSVREMQEEAQRRASALLAGIYADHGEEGSSEDIDLPVRRDIWSDPQLRSLKQRIEEINQRRLQNWASYFEELSLMNRSQDQEKEARRKKDFLFSLRVMQDGRNSFEDIVDAYLAYLQVNVVNSVMESALGILQKFALDACDGKVPEDQLEFGAPWRHTPHTKDHQESLKWAKIQLMDSVQSFINTKFGVYYLIDYCLEILDDPSAAAMLEDCSGNNEKGCSRIYIVFVATDYTWSELLPFDERSRRL